MFERYTERARRALFFARYEASALGTMSIETEHVLLGILKEPDGIGASVLARRGISHAAVREVIAASGKRFSTSNEIPFTEATKKALHGAAAEADRLGHSYIGTEHLLLGLLSEGSGRAAAILTSHGVHLEAARSEIASLLKEATPERDETAPSKPTYELEVANGVVYYAAASVDGFTATAEEDLTWLEPFRSALAEIGHTAFHRTIDALILGGAGYMLRLGFEHSEKPAWLFRGGSLEACRHGATPTDKTLVEFVKELRRRGHRGIWLIGNAAVARELREAGLVNLCVISVIPVLL